MKNAQKKSLRKPPPVAFVYSNKNFIVTNDEVYFYSLNQEFEFTEPTVSCEDIPFIGIDTIALTQLNASNIDSILDYKDNFIWENWCSISVAHDTIFNPLFFKLISEINVRDKRSAQIRSLTKEEGDKINVKVDSCYPFFTDLLDLDKDGKFEIHESLN